MLPVGILKILLNPLFHFYNKNLIRFGFLASIFPFGKVTNHIFKFCTNHSRVNQEFYHQHCRWFTLILFDILGSVFLQNYNLSFYFILTWRFGFKIVEQSGRNKEKEVLCCILQRVCFLRIVYLHWCHLFLQDGALRVIQVDVLF